MKENIKKYAKKSVPIIFVLLVLITFYKFFSNICYEEYEESRKCIDKFHTQDRDGHTIKYYVNFQNKNLEVYTEHVYVDLYYSYKIGTSYIFVESKITKCEK